MKNVRTECSPTIVNKETLMSGDYDFMTKNKIDEECTECTKQWTCKAIIDLLNHKKVDEAMSVMENLFISEEQK